MRDGNTGVYIIDYVEGAFGEEMVARFVPVTVEAQDQQNFSSGDLFDFREYVVSSNRSLKDGRRWPLHETVAFVRSILPNDSGIYLFGMLQLEGAASCLPEGIFYADTSEAVRQPVAEETLDSPWIASYVREGERITFLLFSPQVATSGEAEQLAVSLLGPGAGELVLSTGDVAAMLRQLKTVFWLVLIPCLLAIAYGLAVRVIPHWWQRSPLKTKVAAAVPLGALFLALFAAYIFAWQSLQIPDAFLPTEHFFDLPFYVSQIRWPWRALAWASRRGGISLRGNEWH